MKFRIWSRKVAEVQIQEIISSYISRVQKAIQSIDPISVSKLVEAILQTLNDGRKVVIVGNGGSASTANHMVNDIVMARNFKNQYGQVVSLSDNQAIFSAIANDFSYEEVFSRQIATICESGDLLILISASGNSKNLLDALRQAKKMKIRTSAIVGFDGGELKNLVEIPIHAKTRMSDYGPAEDFALVVNHAIADALRH